MKNVGFLVRKYPLSSLLIIVIWALCLTPIFPETPLDNVQFMDKWTHLVMFGTLSIVVGWEYMKNAGTSFSWKGMLAWAGVMPALMGGLIELAQRYCTGGTRSGEWLDFVADSAGAILGLGAGSLVGWYRARR